MIPKIRKCTYSLKIYCQYIRNMIQYEIHSVLPLNKTAKQYSQHCTKLHNEMTTFCTRKLLKIDFSLCFGFVK